MFKITVCDVTVFVFSLADTFLWHQKVASFFREFCFRREFNFFANARLPNELFCFRRFVKSIFNEIQRFSFQAGFSDSVSFRIPR